MNTFRSRGGASPGASTRVFYVSTQGTTVTIGIRVPDVSLWGRGVLEDWGGPVRGGEVL